MRDETGCCQAGPKLCGNLLLSHGALVPSAEGGGAATGAHMSLADHREAHIAPELCVPSVPVHLGPCRAPTPNPFPRKHMGEEPPYTWLFDTLSPVGTRVAYSG